MAYGLCDLYCACIDLYSELVVDSVGYTAYKLFLVYINTWIQHRFYCSKIGFLGYLRTSYNVLDMLCMLKSCFYIANIRVQNC